MDKLHGRIVHVAKGRHYIRKPMLFRKLCRRAGREFVIDRLVLIIGRNMHHIIMPAVAASLRTCERFVHEPSPERLIAVHEFQLAERRQNQLFLDLLDLAEGGDGFAHGIVARDGDAVVCAASVVMEVFLAAKVCAPVGKIIYILPLYPLPDCLALAFGIVQRYLCEYQLFARL